jgi:hypothetical protein
MNMRWSCALSAAAIFATAAASLAQADPPAPSSEYTCPYLKVHSTGKPSAAAPTQCMDHDVLENLALLEEAGRMLAMADYYEHHGLTVLAVGLCEQVQHLCPGSRLAREATSRLERMQNANQTVIEGCAGEQPRVFGLFGISTEHVIGLTPTGMLTPDLGIPILESDFAVPKDASGNVEEKDAPEGEGPSVSSIGKFSPAGFYLGLAQAGTLTPDLGEPVRTQLALHSGHRDHPRTSVVSVPSFMEWFLIPELTYATEEAAPEPRDEQTLRPELPPVDPKVVDALEKILAEAANPVPAKLIILDSEPEAGDGQEEPVSQWPYVRPPLDIPSLFGPLQKGDAATEAEEEAEEAGAEDEVPANLNDLCREVLDALHSGAWIDIDVSRTEGLRTQCEVQIGGIDFKVIWSDSGHRCAVLKLVPDNPR